MKHVIKTSIVTFFMAMMIGIPCMAQDVEPPFTWEGLGEASVISKDGIEDIDFVFEMSINEDGIFTGKTSNEDGTSKLKHIFFTEKQFYDFKNYFTRKVVLVLLINEYSDNPMLTILKGRLLSDKYFYGEFLLTRYERNSDTAKGLGIGDQEPTLIETDDYPSSLNRSLEQCIPIGSVKIVGDYKNIEASEWEEETISLFNGENFEGWHFYLKDPDVDPEDVWEVRDGMIWCKGQPLGYMRTKTEYSNFKLVVEWKWPEEPTNSGVLLRMSDENTMFPLCIEAQLKHNRAGDVVGMNCDFNENQSDEDEFFKVAPRKKESSENKPGTWNTYEIVCKGDTIELTVNGQFQNKATGVCVEKGFIGLQSEGSPIMFRNIQLTPLQK